MFLVLLAMGLTPVVGCRPIRSVAGRIDRPDGLIIRRDRSRVNPGIVFLRKISMKTVIVGESLGRSPSVEPLDPDRPSGGRLAGLLGMSGDEYRRSVDRVNVSPTGWSESDSTKLRENLLPLLAGRRVVMLGRGVEGVLGGGGTSPWMEWRLTGGFVGSVLPHPSRLSRWWNDPRNVQFADGFMRRSVLPCVHVEGVDGSGKTTLVHELRRSVDARISSMERMRVVETDGPPTSWSECLARVSRRILPGVVCDRSSGLVSELVYGPVLRGGTLEDEGEVWSVVASVVGAVSFVYCRPPRRLLSHAPRDGEDRRHVEAVDGNLSALCDRYDEVMSRIVQMGGTVVEYDRTSSTPERVARCLCAE